MTALNPFAQSSQLNPHHTYQDSGNGMRTELQRRKDSNMGIKSDAREFQDYTALVPVVLMAGLILGYFYQVVLFTG